MKFPFLLFLIASPLAVFAFTGAIYNTQAECNSKCPADCTRQKGKFDKCYTAGPK
ncbi:hypothetical protein GQ607_007756 [Colletotrichum asianum]|uniref:Uncharacterized protein n=1 Tax=Colletotrichum asianum TaxID=702518 RepID=A0A8H3ZVE3_9PEZI|nr:hypothetical protein GQ607_007756 [Colletotrichum asianum]